MHLNGALPLRPAGRGASWGPTSGRGVISRASYDAVVVGSGPNGLAAAITLAQAGLSVLVLEAAERAGGSLRSEALLRSGCIHDRCAAVFPLALASSFFRSLPLASHGLHWIHPPLPLAHPLEDGRVAVLEPSAEATANRLGRDASAYLSVLRPLLQHGDALFDALLGPWRWPRRLPGVLRFALHGMQSARSLGRRRFVTPPARALFAGLAAHSVLPMDQRLTAAFALVLGSLAHRAGWPIPRGGAGVVADALIQHLRSLGGEVVTEAPVQDLRAIPRARATLLDLTPRQVTGLHGTGLSARYLEALRSYRYGPGVCKVDWILDGPVPWLHEDCARAGTLHLGGSVEEIAAAETSPWQGVHAIKPFVILSQPSVFDPTRAPAGKHTLWAYCHVPHASEMDMSERIESQIERFAPGFRARVLARAVRTAVDLERANPNLVGGDITGGVLDWSQLFTRPVRRLDPYSTPVRNLFLCSASTPPGGGVHGLCGYFAARSALRRCF